MGLREIFGRNIHINHDIRKRYEQLLNTYYFREKEMKNIFMLCMALGYRIGRRTPVKNQVGLLNVSSFSDEDLWTIISIGVKEKGDLHILDNTAELRKIATEYAHTGLNELEELVNDYGSGPELELIIEKKAKGLLTTLEKVEE